MKRFTSILLALAMILTLLPVGVFAADNTSFSDVKGNEYFSSAASALEELGILAGYPDGTFGAEKSITRAEMAAVVCRMIDKEADAEKAKGKTDFDDVEASHWASGYINIASKEGIINGDGNGKFRPEDDVKYEEAIKMVVCALGFGDDVKVDPKDWSAGYLKVADEKGITGNLKGTKSKAATRGDIAVMSYNALKSDLDAPTASLASGSYTGTKSVTLTTATKDADIYYTTDGTTPTVKSTKYTKAVSVSKTTTLKAIAVKDGVIASDVMSVDYTIKSSGGGHSKKQTTLVNISVKFLDTEGNEVTTNIPDNVSFSNGFSLGENTVTVGNTVSFVENSIEDYELLNTTINDETVNEINFKPSADTVYNIIFTNQAIDISRRPNDEPIDIGKLNQLTSDGYIDSLLYGDATVRAIDGYFTTIDVNSKADALTVFNQVSPILGLSDNNDNFSVDDIIYSAAGEGTNQRSFYRLNPTTDDIPVFGSDIVLVVDNNGKPNGLHSSYDSEINSVNTTPTLSSEVAENNAKKAFRDKLLNMITDENTSNLSTSEINEYVDSIVSSMDIKSDLVIYSLDETLPTLTWRVNIHTPASSDVNGDNTTAVEYENIEGSYDILPNFDYTYYIYADNLYAGKILNEISNIQSVSSIDTGKDSNGNLRGFNIEVEGDTSYLSDSLRNIKTYQTLYKTTGGFLGIGDTTPPVLPGRLITKGFFGWNKKGVSAHYNMTKVYDFYTNVLGRRSFDGNSGDINVSIEYVPYDGVWDIRWLIDVFANDNACWSPSDKQFMFNNTGNNEAALDTVGHEFTHAVINTIVGGPELLTTLTYQGETGALNEAYADIMGSLVEGKNRNDTGRWLFGEDSGEASRNLSNPESKGCADNYSDFTDQWWVNKYNLNASKDEQKDHGGVHAFNGIVTLAYYKMVMDNDTSCTNPNHHHNSRTNGVSDDTWARIFYNSIHHLTVDAKFVDARMAIINEARAQNLTDEQIQAIQEAFDDVGITGSDVYLAKDTFDWTWYEHQNYEFKYIYPQPVNREHSIEITNRDIRMNGFNAEPYKDFLFMPNSDSNQKLFSFELIRDRTDWHSIEGGGFLFNTTIENNTIEGYCILTTQSGLKLVRINPCDLDSFRNGGYNRVENAGQLLTTVNIGDPYAKQSYIILVEPTEISVWCNGEWVINGYTLPTESTSYGFGPITSHEDHACEQLSYYTFSNIRMESLR